jgi:hypothetical protein
MNDDKSLASRELIRLYPRRSPIRLLGREEVTADIDVMFWEEQPAIWLL